MVYLLSLGITLVLTALLARVGEDSMMRLEHHWTGRCRLACLRVFGVLLVVFLFGAVALAVLGPTGPLPVRIVSTLGLSLMFCFPVYALMAALGLLVPRISMDEGTGLNAGESTR